MIVVIILILSGIANGLMDSGKFYNKPAWANPANTWRNKYHNNDPKQGEKFLFSTNLLVFLTDGWHLLQWIYLRGLVVVIIIYSPVTAFWWIDFIILSAAFSLPKELTMLYCKHYLN